MQEIVQRRGKYAKHFETAQYGQYQAVFGTEPLHYLSPTGEWEELSTLISEVAGGWAAHTSDVRFAVENGYLTISRGGKSIQMRPTAIGMVDRTAPATRWRKLADANYTSAYREGSNVIVPNIFPNTDMKVTLGDGTMSKAFTIRTKPNLPDPVALGWNPANTYLVIVWDITKPAGVVVRDTVTLEVVANGYAGNNDLAVEDAQGNTVVYFKKGEGISAVGRKNPVHYVVAGANVPFAEAFAYNKASSATYPLVIDPTTVTPTSTHSTSINSGGTQDSFVYGDTEWSDGKDSGGFAGVRSFLRYDLNIPNSATCNSAKFVPSLSGSGNSGAIGSNVDILGYDWYADSDIDAEDWAATNVLSSVYQNMPPFYSRYFQTQLAKFGSYIVGLIPVPATSMSTICYSSDGGLTWVAAQATYVQSNNDRLFAHGAYLFRGSISGGRLYRYTTVNGGGVEVNANATGTTVGFSSLSGVMFRTRTVSSNSVTLARHYIDRSTNDGSNWTQVFDAGSVKSSSDGSVIWDGTQYVSFFRRWTLSSYGYCATLHHATSPDGITWTDGGSCNLADVFYNSSSYRTPVYVGGRYIVAPEFQASDTRIRSSTSLTGPWTIATGAPNGVVAYGLCADSASGDAFASTGSPLSPYVSHDAGLTWSPIPALAGNSKQFMSVVDGYMYSPYVNLPEYLDRYSIADGTWAFLQPGNLMSLNTDHVKSYFSTVPHLPIRIRASIEDLYGTSASTAGWLIITYTEGGGGSTISGSFTGDSYIKRVGTAGSFTADSYIKALAAGSITADAFIKAVMQGSVTADAYFMAVQNGTLTADAYIAAALVAWLSPADGSSTSNQQPVLVFTSLPAAANKHFNLQLDKSAAFNTGDLRDIRTVVSLAGWEYWDGSAWQPLPSDGMPAIKTGNSVRYTLQAPLSGGTWQRRVRQG